MRPNRLPAWPSSLFAAVICSSLGPTAMAQSQVAQKEVSQTEIPLSVIDWLGTQAPAAPTAKLRPEEPPVTQTALVPDVAVQSLGAPGPREIGLVPPTVTGLPVQLWAGSDLESLKRLIALMPDLHLPAAQALLYTVLLAEAGAPGGKADAGDALSLARVEKLIARGALDPALSLIEQAGVTTSPQHFDLWMQISLLTGTEDRACAMLSASPFLSADYGFRIFCDVRARRWENAALMLNTAHALDLIPEPQLALLDRFMDPDAFEGEPTLPQPRQMDPLSFRLFETIGEPLPSSTLPRAYAVADLRDLAGWKSQIEAAERLTRAGALPDNRLLGLYTDRKPAASGGVWDRVAALQRFETALGSGSVEAVTKTLPPVWQAMTEAALEVSFATLFAAPLSGIPLTGRAAAIAQEIQLLSPGYENAAAQMQDDTIVVRVALGQLPSARPAEVMQAAVYDAFNDAAPRADLVAMVAQDRLGEAILNVLSLAHKGARGNARTLTDALATLRALGLEDTARRLAIQTLLLDR